MRSAKLLAVIVAAICTVCTLDGSAWADQSAPADLLSRPEPEAGHTRISVGVWVISVDKIDSVAQNFSAYIFLVMR